MDAVRIVRALEQHTAEWSGGRTTELAIFPPEGRYADRAFRWRLSSATVEAPQSVFTSLPGFQRILMILSGAMLLKHEGQREVALKPFEQDRFDGAWKTMGVGQTVDFNLMMGDGVDGALYWMSLSPGQSEAWECASKQILRKERQVFAAYVFSGEVCITYQANDFMMWEKDFLLIEPHKAANESGRALLRLQAGESVGARVVISHIGY